MRCHLNKILTYLKYFQFYKMIRDLAEKMHTGRVDDFELAVFTLILLLKHGK